MKRLLLLVLTCVPASLWAGPISFDFEALVPTYGGSGTRPGSSLTSLVLTNGGLTVTITRQGGTAFDTVSNTGGQTGKPAGWGTVSLDPFFAPAGATGWIFDFSASLSAFSIQLRDYGADSDTETLTAFSGAGITGSNLGSVVDTYGVQAFPVLDTATIRAAGIKSVLITGASNAAGFENSVFFDNLIATTVVAGVPVPSTFTLFAAGCAGLVFLVRRKRSRPQP